MKAVIFMLTGLLLMLSGHVAAGEVEVKVTRIEADQYKVVDDDLYLLTEYCFEMVDNETVLLRLEEGPARIVFPKQKSTCDIKTVYGRTRLDPGSYTLNVTRIEAGWYAVVGKGAVFRTDGCYGLADNSAARAIVADEGSGVLLMPSLEEECRIEGVYVETELKLVRE